MQIISISWAKKAVLKRDSPNTLQEESMMAKNSKYHFPNHFICFHSIKSADTAGIGSFMLRMQKFNSDHYRIHGKSNGIKKEMVVIFPYLD